jgi:hypothetical protein
MTEERSDSPRRMTPQEIEAVRVSPNIRKWLEMMRDSLAEAELYGFADECRRRLAMLEKETTEERSDSPRSADLEYWSWFGYRPDGTCPQCGEEWTDTMFGYDGPHCPIRSMKKVLP